MAKRNTEVKAKVETKDERRRRLVAEANENPNAFFPFEECGIILGFGTNAMTALNAAGAPQAFRKMNPAQVRQWIGDHQESIGKIRNGDE